MIEKLEGIVLDSFTVKEKDIFVVLFTKEKGKITCIAKSGRISKRRFPNALQPITHLLAKLRKGIIEEAEVINYYEEIKEKYEKVIAALAIMEILKRILPEGKEEEKVFSETLSFLYKLSAEDSTLASAVNSIIRILKALGYLGFDGRCSICGKKLDKGGRFIPQRLKFLCLEHGKEGVVMDKGCMDVIKGEKEIIGKDEARKLFLFLKIFFQNYFHFIPNTFRFLKDFR